MAYITQAVISAGGLGTRLRPTTDKIPKVMIPICGKPLLEHHIEQFRRHGVNEFFFTLHYLPQVVQEYFGDGAKLGVKINYFIEKEPLGSAGGIKTFENMLGDTFFFIYGDVFSEVDYGKMAAAFSGKSDAVGMERVARLGFRGDADLAELGKDMRFLKIYPKPHTERRDDLYTLRGIFVLKKEVLQYIPPARQFDLGEELLPALIAAGKAFCGYECSEYSKGIDTVEKWQEVERHLEEHPSHK